MKPFKTTCSTAVPDRATVRASKVEATHAFGAGRGRTTTVTLPDGYTITFVGPLGKIAAVRNALECRATGRVTSES